MLEILAVLTLFLAKTLINLPWVVFINPFVPLLAVYFAKKRRLLPTSLILLAVFAAGILYTGDILIMTCNYLVIFPLYFIFEDNFFQSRLLKILIQGSIAVFVFYLFRLIFLPVAIGDLIRAALYTELFLLALIPFYRIFR